MLHLKRDGNLSTHKKPTTLTVCDSIASYIVGPEKFARLIFVLLGLERVELRENVLKDLLMNGKLAIYMNCEVFFQGKKNNESKARVGDRSVGPFLRLRRNGSRQPGSSWTKGRTRMAEARSSRMGLCLDNSLMCTWTMTRFPTLRSSKVLAHWVLTPTRT